MIFYLTGFGLQLTRLLGHAAATRLRKLVLGCSTLAVVAHGISALGVIHSDRGFHFGIAEISTLFAVSVSIVVLLSSLRKPLDNLLLVLFPLAIACIIGSLTLTSTRPPTELGAGLASHILFSVLAYSFITIAAAQAVLLAYQNHQLKNARAGGFVSRLPALQDMETFLFELLWVGQLLLSAGIVTSFLFVDDIWARDGVIHKTFFSLLAWCVFSVLLWGRHWLGWRGVQAISWTISGFALMILAYYGTNIALQYVFA